MSNSFGRCSLYHSALFPHLFTLGTTACLVSVHYTLCMFLYLIPSYSYHPRYSFSCLLLSVFLPIVACKEVLFLSRITDVQAVIPWVGYLAPLCLYHFHAILSHFIFTLSFPPGGFLLIFVALIHNFCLTIPIVSELHLSCLCILLW